MYPLNSGLTVMSRSCAKSFCTQPDNLENAIQIRPPSSKTDSIMIIKVQYVYTMLELEHSLQKREKKVSFGTKFLQRVVWWSRQPGQWLSNIYLPIILPSFWFAMIVVHLKEDKKLETCLENSNHNSIDKNFDGDCKFRPPQRSLI